MKETRTLTSTAREQYTKLPVMSQMFVRMMLLGREPQRNGNFTERCRSGLMSAYQHMSDPDRLALIEYLTQGLTEIKKGGQNDKTPITGVSTAKYDSQGQR